MERNWLTARHLVVAGLLLTFVLALAGCGGGGSSSSSAGNDSGGSGSSEGSGWDKPKVEAILKEATEPVKWTGPKEPSKAVPGKRIAVIPAFAAAEGLLAFDEGVKQAAEVLGWHETLIDGKGTPQGYSAAVDQAITENVDGVVLGAIAPSQIPTEMKALKKAGIPVVDYGTVEKPTEELWLGNIGLNVPKEAEWIAAAIAKETEGEGKIMLVQSKEFNDGNERTEFFREDIKTLCPGCEIANETDMTVGEIETKLGPKIGAVLQANPEINMIYAPYDAAVPPMVVAVKQAGLTDDVKIVSRGGAKQSSNYLRNGEVQVATIGEPNQWIGWEALDTLNRHYNNQKIDEEVTKSDPIKLLTKETAPPPGKYFEAPEVDWRKHYEELWGK
jgi:ribose transport system substrate-binding protein